MLGKCKKCNSEVGYFKLSDGLCNSCIEKSNGYISNFSRLTRSMPMLKWLFPAFIIFQIASPWIFQGLASASPEVAAIMNIPEVGTQFIFSIILLVVLFIPVLISYPMRFFIARRRLNIILAWIILLFIFSIPISIVLILKSGSPPSYTTIIFFYCCIKDSEIKKPCF